MQINVVKEQGADLLEGLAIEALVDFVLGQMGYKGNTAVSVLFVSAERMHDLNLRYRGIDKPTDVLSFECDTQPYAGEGIVQTEEFELGDIVIATDVALAQTEEFGTALEEEITLLCVHGLLHLCGYDHQNEEEAQLMEALEEKLIAAWNATRAGRA